jgi:hypothetical protein
LQALVRRAQQLAAVRSMTARCLSFSKAPGALCEKPDENDDTHQHRPNEHAEWRQESLDPSHAYFAHALEQRQCGSHGGLVPRIDDSRTRRRTTLRTTPRTGSVACRVVPGSAGRSGRVELLRRGSVRALVLGVANAEG